MNGWQTGEPKKAGYYLASWLRCGPNEKPTVSELWFNESANPKWWSSRGYMNTPRLGGMSSAIHQPVIAWQAMPPPYEVKEEAPAADAAKAERL